MDRRPQRFLDEDAPHGIRPDALALILYHFLRHGRIGANEVFPVLRSLGIELDPIDALVGPVDALHGHDAPTYSFEEYLSLLRGRMEEEDRRNSPRWGSKPGSQESQEAEPRPRLVMTFPA